MKLTRHLIYINTIIRAQVYHHSLYLSLLIQLLTFLSSISEYVSLK